MPIYLNSENITLEMCNGNKLRCCYLLDVNQEVERLWQI